MPARKPAPITVSADVLADVNDLRAQGISIGSHARHRDDEPTAAEIHAALAGLNTCFDDFKAHHEKRVDALENALKDVSQQMAFAAVGDRGPGLLSAGGEQHKVFAQFCRGQLGPAARIQAAMSTDSQPDGGYLVPEQVEAGIARIAVNLSPMRRLARVVNTNTGVYKKVVSLNGVQGGWTTEKASRSQTAGMNLSELAFNVHEMTAMPAVTQTLLDDAAVDVAAEVSNEIAQAFSLLEGAAFINGDGVNKPRGILQQTMVANGSWAWGKIGFGVTGVAAALSDGSNNGLDKLNSLLYSLKADYRANASWLMNSATAAVVSQLKTTSGEYLWQPPVQLGMPAMLFGRPVEIDEGMDDIGANKFPIAIGDWQRGYLIVDRLGIRLLRDPYSSKPYVLFYSTKRVGGNVADFAAIKILKCSA